jgi:hypothetical protein
MSNVTPFAPQQISAPSLITAQMDTLIRMFSSRLDDHPTDRRRKRMPATRAPDADAYAALERRRDELRASLLATPGDQADDVILALLMGWAQFSGSADEAEVRVRMYAEALTEQPTWAIEKARLRFARGKVQTIWDRHSCPSMAQVAAECRYVLLDIETELARIEIILGAELYDTGATDDDRANAVAHWETVKADMRGESAITERTEDEISAERVSMARANERFRERARIAAEAQGRGQAMWGRLPISDELARQIGLTVPVPADEEADVH